MLVIVKADHVLTAFLIKLISDIEMVTKGMFGSHMSLNHY